MEDEEWEDVLVGSFVPAHRWSNLQTPGKLLALKRMLKSTWIEIPKPTESYHCSLYCSFRTPENKLVILSYSRPTLRVFDKNMKEIPISFASLDFYTSSHYFQVQSDLKS